MILPRQVWVASGHVRRSTTRWWSARAATSGYRADQLAEEYAERTGKEVAEDDLSDVPCPNCGTRGQYTEPRDFNMMLKTYLGPVESEEGLHYLRPETAQGIFVNFLNVQTTSRQEAAVRHRPDGQELPQRDHARQLHLPHARVRADGDGVLRRAGHRRGAAPVLDRRAHALVRRPRHRAGEPAPVRAPQGEALALLEAHRRHRVPLRLHRPGVGRARGHRQPHRLRPHHALQPLRRRPVVLRPGHRARGTGRT